MSRLESWTNRARHRVWGCALNATRIRCPTLIYSLAILILATFATGLQAGSAEDEFVRSIQNNDLNQIRVKIDLVEDVDIAAPDGRTALMLAAKRGQRALVERLLNRGADPNSRNANGGSPVMFAAISGDVDVVKLITEAGANVDAKGSNGWSAIMIAAAKGHGTLVEYLIKLGADVDTVDVYGWTPLIRAAYEGRRKVVGVLIDSGRASLDASDDQSASALHHAAGNGYLDIVRLLLDGGANPDTRDNESRTPLHRARAKDHAPVVEILCRVSRNANC